MTHAVDKIRTRSIQLGGDPDVAHAVSLVESGGGDNVYGDPVDDDPLGRFIQVDGVKYTSLGPFQERIAGGAGETHLRKGGTLADLFDPVSATERFFGRFGRASEIAPLGATPGQIAAAAQRPADQEGYASKVDALIASLRSSAPRDAHDAGAVPVTSSECPPGQVRDLRTGRCGYIGRGGFIPAGSEPERHPGIAGTVRSGSGGAPVPGSKEILEREGRGAASFDPLAGVARAIDDARKGAAQLAVAAGVIAVAGILIYGGMRKTLG